MKAATEEKLKQHLAGQLERELSLLDLKFEKSKNLRSQTALTCLEVARQHYAAILVLLRNRPILASTAHAIFRPLLEATLRGQWIYYCATDEQIKNFLENDKGQLDMSSLIKAIDEQLGNVGLHDVVYKQMWPVLSSFTHTYSRQVTLWFSASDLETVYPDELLVALLDQTEKIHRLILSTMRSISDAR